MENKTSTNLHIVAGDAPRRDVRAFPTALSPGKQDVGKEYISVNGYDRHIVTTLNYNLDEVEREVGPDIYERIIKDPTVAKDRDIMITGTLADDLQLAPGTTQEEAGSDSEYENYLNVLKLCERMVAHTAQPMREVLAQILSNGTTFGNGLAEVVWDYRPADDKVTLPKAPAKKSFGARFKAFVTRPFIKAEETPVKVEPEMPQIRQNLWLMPVSIKVKPRTAYRYVVDEYDNLLGVVQANRAVSGFNGLVFNLSEVIRRDKFLIYTHDKQNNDPRGQSRYRRVYNYWNLKQQIPKEFLRFLLQEAVPSAVGTLPQDASPFEPQLDENGEIVYEDESKTRPKMIPVVLSFRNIIKGFRSSSGAVIPFGATLAPFKKSGESTGQVFPNALKACDKQMEAALLLQELAQSEGEHQARAASITHADILGGLFFWFRWNLCMMLLYDFFATGVKYNMGEWALKYLPQISLGDSERRDWVEELKALADAYFKGFVDDTQRPSLMAELNLPKPGKSRQEQAAEAQTDVNGNPVPQNGARPDKQPANRDRNNGNGTPKKGVADDEQLESFGRHLVAAMGHHGGRSKWIKANISK